MEKMLARFTFNRSLKDLKTIYYVAVNQKIFLNIIHRIDIFWCQKYKKMFQKKSLGKLLNLPSKPDKTPKIIFLVWARSLRNLKIKIIMTLTPHRDTGPL